MHRRTLRRSMTVAVPLAAAIVAVAAWRAVTPDPAPAPGLGTTSSDVRQSPDEAQDYWTPERMREAQPAPMPEDS